MLNPPSSTELGGILVSFAWFILLSLYGLIHYALYRFFAREKGLAIPLYEPPNGFSPAGAGYVLNGLIDEKLCIASVLNMAKKGYLSITKTDDDYTLKKLTNDNSLLAEEEKVLAKMLFLKEESFVLYDISRKFLTMIDPYFVDALIYYRKRLEQNYKQYFSSFRLGWYISGFICFFAVLSTAAAMQLELIVFFLMCLGVLFLFASVYGIIVYPKTKQKGYFTSIPLFFLVSIYPFLYFNEHHTKLTVWMFIPFVFILGLFIIHSLILRMPILYIGKHRKIRNALAGFKRYLATAEENRYKILDNPDVPVRVNEKILPYAIAFGVETEWTERLRGMFSTVLYSEEKENKNFSEFKDFSYYEGEKSKGAYKAPDLPEDEEDDINNK